MSTLVLPQQISDIPDEREAYAPYNFVPLPAQIVLAEEVPEAWQVRVRRRRNGRIEESVPPRALRQDTYYPQSAGRYTGSILCTLTTESPLYVRCALTLAQFEQSEKQKKAEERDDTAQDQAGFRQLTKNTPEFFYTASKEVPVIPGSSLRGMLRALVEIAGYSKMAKVSPTGGYFFRAVAAPVDDPLREPYESVMGKYGKNVRVGYLEREGDQWYIRPAQKIGGAPFIKIKEWNKKTHRENIPRALVFNRLNDNGYRPQYVQCSFTTRPGRQGVQIDQIGPPSSLSGGQEGWMVTSGNMLETNDRARGVKSPRTSHTIVAKATEQIRLLIDPQAIKDYRAGMTEFQKDTPFDPQWGALIVGRPIFYCEPARSQKVVFFGHSPNFRIPYRPRGADHALAPTDFLPPSLRDTALPDLAEAIFGFVRDDEQSPDREQTRAGRVFVGDATFNDGQGTPWLDESGAPIVPRILGSPKPTTFQHYLVQTSSQKRELRHYASVSGNPNAPMTAIRGHKLYWHKGAVERADIEDADFLQEPETEQTNDTQHTQFRPVKAGMQLSFPVHFENLSQIELGALLWVLRLAADEQHRLKLGMGKPLGMGVIKITHTVSLTDRVRRYKQLFDDQEWATGGTGTMSPQAENDCVAAFERYVLEQSGERAGALRETLRIQCLLALLKWPGPPIEQTRYMEIEPDNKYDNRPVLPSPLQVIGVPVPHETTLARTHVELVASPRPPRSAPPPVIPAVGDVITGNRSGPIREPIRGVKVDINRKWYQVSPNITVIGVIRAEDAGGQVSGGFKGEVVGRQEEKQVVYLFLRPVKGEK